MQFVWITSPIVYYLCGSELADHEHRYMDSQFEIDSLLKKGWKLLSPYGEGQILGRENTSERILYDPKKDEIVLKYRVYSGPKLCGN